MGEMNHDQLYQAVTACALNPDISLKEIENVFEMIREQYDLDVVFAMTNREYKYQLRYLICCEKDGTKLHRNEKTTLSLELYENLLVYYKNHAHYERVLNQEADGCTGYVLQCALIRDNEYYGTIGFGRTEKRAWTQEERDLIRMVSQVVLVYLGLNRLKDVRNKTEYEEKKMTDNPSLEYFHVDLVSGKCHALKSMMYTKNWCKEWEQYEDLFRKYILRYVNQIYAERLRNTLSLKSIKKNISIDHPRIVIEYPIEQNGKFYWIKAQVELSECDENNVPRTALLSFQDMTEEEQKNAYMTHAEIINRDSYAVIAGIDPETGQYIVYVDNLGDLVQYFSAPAVGNYQDLMETLTRNGIEPVYKEQLRSMFQLERMRAHFLKGNEILSCEYRQKVGEENYWVRIEAAKAETEDDREGKIVLYFSDITEEKNREIELQAISQSLEIEHERALQAELQAMVDPLTGAYNRKGFDFAVSQYRSEHRPMGFVLLDVDHFKILNDTYGHAFGDDVLKLISKLLMASFRNEDKVFRLGGDEFALLLYGCKKDAWQSLQMKFENLHQYLKAKIREDISVTLSAGFCQSNLGYSEEMFELSDIALYHTKSGGRAGLSQIGMNREILNSWHDEKMTKQQALMQKSVILGSWRIEFSKDRSQKPRLFIDEAAHAMTEVPTTLTPEESFAFWRERISVRHQELYEEVVRKLENEGQAEWTYTWNHPTRGEVTIRSISLSQDRGSLIECCGYMRELKQSELVLSQDDGQFLMQALNRVYFCTYYFNLETFDYFIVKGHEDEPDVKELHHHIDVTFKWFLENFVHPDDRKKVAEFSDLTTLAERLKGKTNIDCEYLSVSQLGWCRTTIMPVKWDEEGNVTHAVSMSSSIDHVKKAELEANRERLHALEHASEDTLFMCEVNLTRNCFSNVQTKEDDRSFGKHCSSLDELQDFIAEGIYDPDERREYCTRFRREELTERFERGESHISLEHFYRLRPDYTDMVETAFDLIKDPIRGEIIGIYHARELNVAKMSEILLQTSLGRDYPMAALVYADTGEYLLYEVENGSYCVHKQDYWGQAYERLATAIDESEQAMILQNLNGRKIIAALEEKDEYGFIFYGTYRGKRRRLEAKFRYEDRKHHLLLAVLRDITDQELYRKMQYESERDPLTGIYNRAAVFRKSRELLDANPDEQYVMMHCDIQHFHLYNTFFGEEGGNELLRKMAGVFRKLAADYEGAAAYGRIESDVFCAFFPVDRGLFEKHVRDSFSALELFSPNFPLKLAVGVFWVTDPSMSMEEMFSRATIAAKSHKNNLFDRVSRYDDSMEQNLKDTQQITSEMTSAIEQEQFEVYLQPKFELKSEKMIGAEALVRWQHPVHGIISPAKFIPAFEQNGFIANLDRYMWEHVCRILRRWQDEGKEMYPISVNLSRISMYSRATVPFLKGLIEKYQLDPEYLELELTESAYMDDPEDLKRMLRELQEYGFHILIDDFGSGYSSLNTLRELPVDVLKLDMKFLSDTQNDPRANAVLSSVVRMSKMLNLPIVAEGVEKREQANYLRDIGCEYVQGFLFARPMPVDEYEKLLAEV